MSETVSAQDTQPAKGKGAANEFIEIVKTIVYALLIALFLRVIFFQPFTIPSASMEPNLYEGDYIIISKWNYGYSHHSIPFSPPIFKGRILEQTPHRGDIIVFKLPSDVHKDYVKRLVGLPGDRIQVIDGVLHLNGKPVERANVGPGTASCPYGLGQAQVTRFQEVIDGRKFVTNDCGLYQEQDNTDVFLVPQGYYFMMGDNRDNSSDSRVDPAVGGVGFVPAENLEGKAQIILLSWKPEASIFKPWTWILDARPSRFFKLLK
jgi:signal peptidase I